MPCWIQWLFLKWVDLLNTTKALRCFPLITSSPEHIQVFPNVSNKKCQIVNFVHYRKTRVWDSSWLLQHEQQRSPTVVMVWQVSYYIWQWVSMRSYFLYFVCQNCEGVYWQHHWSTRCTMLKHPVHSLAPLAYLSNNPINYRKFMGCMPM